MKWRYLFRAFKAGYRDQKLEIALARAVIRKGDLVADVGANKGAYLYWLRKSVGADGLVFAFEPQPRLAAYLNQMVPLMGWRNVVVRPIAISESKGTQSLHVPGGGISPGASLESSVLGEKGGETFDCVVSRLDDELRERGRLTFLKVDVEGHELSVFKGAVEIIKRDNPVILFECEERHLVRHSVDDVFEHLKKAGYEGFFLTRRQLISLSNFEATLHQKRQKDRFWDEPDYFNNFLFTPRNFDLTKLVRFRE
ncbi:MAG: methyltransferase FkbM [Verrucomicrobiales bacterium]|nr:methyltransferase FkbM [Verrucomicrobiales bacterium]